MKKKTSSVVVSSGVDLHHLELTKCLTVTFDGLWRVCDGIGREGCFLLTGEREVIDGSCCLLSCLLCHSRVEDNASTW